MIQCTSFPLLPVDSVLAAMKVLLSCVPKLKDLNRAVVFYVKCTLFGNSGNSQCWLTPAENLFEDPVKHRQAIQVGLVKNSQGNYTLICGTVS